AKDAYLNIVVGNVYHLKFTRNPLSFIQKQQPYSLNRMFDFDVVRNGEYAWRRGDDGSIAMVRRMMGKNNILFTRYAHEAAGGFYKQTIQKAGKGEAAIKNSDPRMTIDKFGGYTERKGAYFMLVEHTEKDKRMRSIETVFLMNKALYERDPISYCTSVLGISEPKILIPKIKIDSLVEYDGFRMHISGRTGTRIIYKNANQLIVSPEQVCYIKQIGKYLERCADAREDVIVSSFDGITIEGNEAMYRLLLDKLRTARYIVKYETVSDTVQENSGKFNALPLADQCRVLMQVLNLFKANAASADLKLLCGKARIGILLTSKNLNGFAGHSFKLINQSVTGFFEQEIDLLGDQF
ncbi:MAG: type II CRISPR RNA-guided endonuclease Cas9, partial [Clostridia bacterium]|nr:type II CRISPR RNA-guided endonuclease Cas9 [Clostridia bacterium]